ncbi:hypothetical protein LTR08_000926 [Meristemomyces frigidus]|nr:hypothetical protein LTR08_000926 [Meristemomyces frigidus]
MPPSVRYYNQTAPFWDFLAGLEEQGSGHPFFGNLNNNNGNNSNDDSGAQEAYNEHQRSNPWTQGWNGFPFGPMPHRGRHGHHGPPPPPPGNGQAGAADNDMTPTSEEDDDPEEVVLGSDGLPQVVVTTVATVTVPAVLIPTVPKVTVLQVLMVLRVPMVLRVLTVPMTALMALAVLTDAADTRDHVAEVLAEEAGADVVVVGHMVTKDQLFGENATAPTDKKDKSEDDFTPEVDVFDTTDSFIVHISLPGAKKEDLGVHWDAEKSELNIAGVIHRPGDEELLKTLALDERKVGAFARKVRLGSRANPAQVDVDGIGAKLEDGILRVDVPKLDSGYVEIKKVDIE